MQVNTVDVDPKIFSEPIVYEKLIYNNKNVESHEALARLRNVILSDPKISFKKDGDFLKIKCENMAYGVIKRGILRFQACTTIFECSGSLIFTEKNDRSYTFR